MPYVVVYRPPDASQACYTAAMRVLIINGSPRRNGNTARTIEILAGDLASIDLEGEEIECEVIELSGSRIEPCRGCRRCFDRGEEQCPVSDDQVLQIRGRMLAADAVVLATPVYVADVSGLMKTLIDRLAFVCHRPQFHQITAMCLATTGASPTRHTIRTLTGALISWGANPAVSLGLRTGALSSREAIAEQHGKRIRAATQKLVLATLRARARRPSLVRLLVFRIQQKGWAGVDPGSIDYAYWHDNGWLEARTSYFFPHRTGPLRRGVARLVGGAIGRIFT